MDIPFTALELSMISTFLLAVSFYCGHYIGVKEGASTMFEFLKLNGQIEIEEEIVEYDDEDTDR